MKRYSMQYESDRVVCQSNNHVFGYASSLRAAKGYIGRAKRMYAEDNPRNFRVYDHWADVDPATDYVPCVYAVEA